MTIKYGIQNKKIKIKSGVYRYNDNNNMVNIYTGLRYKVYINDSSCDKFDEQILINIGIAYIPRQNYDP